MEHDDHPVGLTRDAGFQIGVRRTLPFLASQVWQQLVSPGGRACWLAPVEELVWRPGAPYTAANGVCGVVRVFEPGSHLRVTWQPPEWPRASLIQVRVLPKGTACVLAFHQELLPGTHEREQRRAVFAASLDQIAAQLGQ
jgi:uncharacterized protein YndB with AHSA1/START domain